MTDLNTTAGAIARRGLGARGRRAGAPRHPARGLSGARRAERRAAHAARVLARGAPRACARPCRRSTRRSRGSPRRAASSSRASCSGLAADLRQAVPSLVKLNTRLIPFLKQLRALSSCTNTVLVPYMESEIPSIEEGNSGNSVREQINRSFVGLAGESRVNDANTPVFHIQGVNPFNLATGRIEPAAPLDANMPPPHRPDVPCETQQPPNLSAPGGAGHGLRRHPVKLAIKKHWVDFLAIAGLAVIGVAIARVHPEPAGLPLPARRESPKRIEIELSNAQAVQPGQGQTVRVAGVEVGRIADVKVEDGLAVVTLEIEPEYEGLIRSDATALLRPKTALKDMFVEVDPGRGKPVPDGGRHHGREHAAGHRPGRDLLGARRRHAPVPEAARGRRRQGPRRARRRPARGVPAPRADPPRHRPRDARDGAPPPRAQGADPRLRPPDDRAREPPAGPAPARDGLAHRLRRAGERGYGDHRVRGAAAGLAARLGARARERPRVRAGAALLARVAAPADPEARRDERRR